MFKDCIYFTHLCYHFSQTISQKWNLMRSPKNSFQVQNFVESGTTKTKQL